MTFNQLIEKQPNREPFLFLGEIENITESVCINKLYLDEKLWFFKCHWPNHPNMPAMLQLEAMSQTASLILFNQDDTPDYLYLAEVKNSFFRTEVKPNDTLLISAELRTVNNNLYSFKCKIKNQKRQIVASTKMTLVKPKS
jgi:3-hydroxymyristoyl/3-hydroxydecanoyl-(acyl carrier protein) dehydratase